MNEDLLNSIPLFESLSKDARAFIETRLKRETFASGEVIVRQGDTGDSLYIITDGLVKVTKRDRTGTSRELARFRTGDYFGEMSLLAGQPRSADIVAITDTSTVMLRKEDMDRVMEEYPAIAVHFSKVLSKRLRDTSQLNLRTRRTISIIALYSQSLDPHLQNILAIHLAASLSKELLKRVVLVDAGDHEEDISGMLGIEVPRADNLELSDAHDIRERRHLLACVRSHKTGLHVLSIGAGARLGPRAVETEMAAILKILQEEYDYIFINCASSPTPLIRKVLDASDLLVYLTESSDDSVQQCRHEIDQFWHADDAHRELIIGVVHDEARGHVQGEALESTLAPHAFMMIHTKAATIHHFLRTGRLFVYEHPQAKLSLSLQHLARRIGRVRIGLALGSGSARGFSHVGVLKVLEKNGIPIDMIAGTSMGAFVGGFFAAGVTASHLEQLVLSYRNKRKVRQTIFDLTLPLYGLSKGTHLSRFMRAHLKDITFDDLATPFVAVATDINTGHEIVLRHGTLWEALRASGSVPVMFEPYLLDGRYLVDGSITNPLPTDILIEHDVDFIISCSVNTVSTLSKRYGTEESNETGVLSGHASGSDGERETQKCGILNALSRSMGIMSATNTTNKARLADIDIRPDVSYIDWTDFHRGDELLREGEEAAEKAMPTILELLRENRN